MSGIIANTDKKFYKPWLLSQESLIELDAIFDSFVKELEDENDSHIKLELQMVGVGIATQIL